MDAPADAGASSTADFRAVSASFAPGGETDVTPDVLTRFGVSENWKAVTAVAATSSNAAVLRGIVRMHWLRSERNHKQLTHERPERRASVALPERRSSGELSVRSEGSSRSKALVVHLLRPGRLAAAP